MNVRSPQAFDASSTRHYPFVSLSSLVEHAFELGYFLELGLRLLPLLHSQKIKQSLAKPGIVDRYTLTHPVAIRQIPKVLNAFTGINFKVCLQ